MLVNIQEVGLAFLQLYKIRLLCDFFIVGLHFTSGALSHIQLWVS